MATRRRKGDVTPADLAAARRALLSAGLPLATIVGGPIELLVKCSWHGHRHPLIYIQAIVLSVVNDGDSEEGVTRIRISLERLEGRIVHELVAGEPSPVRWHLMCEDADGK